MIISMLKQVIIAASILLFCLGAQAQQLDSVLNSQNDTIPIDSLTTDSLIIDTTHLVIPPTAIVIKKYPLVKLIENNKYLNTRPPGFFYNKKEG